MNTPNRIVGCLSAVLLFSAVLDRHAAADVVASADMVEYSSGHADIGVAYEDGAMELHWHFGGEAVLDGEVAGTDVELSPGGAYVRVPDAARVEFTPTPDFAFTGLTPGESGSLWFLPFPPPSNLPAPGLSTGELMAANWSGPIRWTMSAVSRPAGAEFSLWRTVVPPGGVVPEIDVLFATADGFDSNNSFTLGAGTHQHFNWGFTEEGVYDITLTASGNHLTDGFRSDTGTFKFVVGSATAVPEAGTVSLLALTSLGLVAGGWYQRRRRSVDPTEATTI